MTKGGETIGLNELLSKEEFDVENQDVSMKATHGYLTKSHTYDSIARCPNVLRFLARGIIRGRKFVETPDNRNLSNIRGYSIEPIPKSGTKWCNTNCEPRSRAKFSFNDDPEAVLLYNESVVASSHNLSTMDTFYEKQIRGELERICHCTDAELPRRVWTVTSMKSFVLTKVISKSWNR